MGLNEVLEIAERSHGPDLKLAPLKEEVLLEEPVDWFPRQSEVAYAEFPLRTNEHGEGVHAGGNNVHLHSWNNAYFVIELCKCNPLIFRKRILEGQPPEVPNASAGTNTWARE
jgi:hypothetical protein